MSLHGTKGVGLMAYWRRYGSGVRMFYVESCHGRVRLFDDNIIPFSAGFQAQMNRAGASIMSVVELTGVTGPRILATSYIEARFRSLITRDMLAPRSPLYTRWHIPLQLSWNATLKHSPPTLYCKFPPCVLKPILIPPAKKSEQSQSATVPVQSSNIVRNLKIGSSSIDFECMISRKCYD